MVQVGVTKLAQAVVFGGFGGRTLTCGRAVVGGGLDFASVLAGHELGAELVGFGLGGGGNRSLQGPVTQRGTTGEP